MKKTITLAALVAFVGMVGSALAATTNVTYLNPSLETNVLIDLKATVKLTGVQQGAVAVDSGTGNGTFKSARFRLSNKDILDELGLDKKSKIMDRLSLVTASVTEIKTIVDNGVTVVTTNLVTFRELLPQAVTDLKGAETDVSEKLVGLLSDEADETSSTAALWEAILQKATQIAGNTDEISRGLWGVFKGKTKADNDNLTAAGVASRYGRLYAGARYTYDTDGHITGTTDEWNNRSTVWLEGAASEKISQKVKKGLAKVAITKTATSLTGVYEEHALVNVGTAEDPDFEDQTDVAKYSLNGKIMSKGKAKDLVHEILMSIEAGSVQRIVD